MSEKEPAIEQLRRMVSYFDWNNETCNTSYTMDELQKIAAFAFGPQGGRVPEMYDTWPDYLLRAVLRAKLGAQLPEEMIERAGKES